jgi:glycosyltransferase involved in cell wall biosynthesis
LRIVIATDSYPPYVDGVARYLRRVVPMLAERGHKVFVLAPGFSLRKKLEFEGNGIGVVRNPALTMLRFNYYRPSLPSRVCASIIRWADVVLTPSIAPLGIYSIIYSRRRGKPIAFFCMHDEQVLIGKTIWLPMPKQMVDFIVRRLYLRCPVILFATQRFRDKILRIGIPEDRLFYAPFGIEFDFFSSGNRKAARKKLGIPQDAKVVLYLGRMSEEKNVLTLIKTIPEVAKHVPKLCYVFAGYGPNLDEYRNEGTNAAKTARAKAIFTGVLKTQDLPHAYAAADLFVHPSFHEAQAFTVLEAMCAGVPVVTPMDHGEYSYLKEGHNARFVKDVRNHLEFADRIIELLNDDAKRARMGRNAAAMARSFTWDAHIDKLEEALKKAIAAKKRSS